MSANNLCGIISGALPCLEFMAKRRRLTERMSENEKNTFSPMQIYRLYFSTFSIYCLRSLSKEW